MGQEEVPPAVKHGHGDAEAGAEFFYRMQRKEGFRQHPQDEKKAIYKVSRGILREHSRSERGNDKEVYPGSGEE